MSARGPGGVIPNQGRGPQAQGVGRNAKRHDLERPTTPGLHGSDLQQGDVQAMEQGQRIAPTTKQGPGIPAGPKVSSGPGAPRQQQSGGQFPNALQFAQERLGGTIQTDPNPQRVRQVDVDPRRFLGVAKQMATSPGGGGTVGAAFIEQMSRIGNNPSQTTVRVVDLSLVDDALERIMELGGE